MSFDPAEDRKAMEQQRTGQRAANEYIGDGLAKVLEGGDSLPEGAKSPQLEEADRKANQKVPTNWQWS